MRAVLFLIFIIFSSYSFSQQVTWGFNVGGSSTDYAQGAHVDAGGNVYFCGEFRGTNIDFDPSPAISLKSSNGSADAFFAKYTSAGQYLFSVTIGGASIDKVSGVTTDQAGNIYITGFFRGPNVDFDPSPATAFLTSNGESGGDPGYGGDIFVAKYTSTGQYLWAFNVGGQQIGDAGLIIKSDAAGNLFVGGYFRETIDFDPGTGTANLQASTGTAFLARYNTSGQYQWAFNFGAPNIDNVIFDMRLDASNNVYVTGFFQGTGIDFDPGPGTAILNSSGNFEGYLAKYNSSGQYQFAFKIGGTGLDTGRGITIDNSGNIYILGDFNGTNIDFDPSPSTAFLNSNGVSDIFVAKYTNTGQYVWAFNAGSAGGEIGWKIETDNTSIFVTGGFSGIADFNPSAATDNLTSNGGADIFLAKYTSNGVYQCAFNIGSPANDNGFDIVLAGADRFYLVGGFQGTNVDFAPTQSTFLLNSNGGDDAFMIKYYWPPSIMPAGTLQGSTLCSSGNGQLTFNATSGTSPFTITYSDGVNTYTQSNVYSGVPFNVQVNPIITTTYTVTMVQDAIRCSPINTTPAISATIIVGGLSVVTNNDLNICRGTSVQLNTISAATTYSWTPAIGLSDPSIPNPIATPPVPTQYIVTGTNAVGCIGKDTINIGFFQDPLITISNDTAICSNSSVQLFVSGGQSYSWSPVSTLNNPALPNPVATPIADTWYYVTITDNNLCVHKDSVHITIRPDPVFAINPDVSICNGQTTQLQASGGNIYSWQPASSLNNSALPNPIATPITTTTYTVVVTESVCNRSQTLSTVVFVETPQVNTLPDADICRGASIQLLTSGAQTYSWQPSTGLSNAAVANPVASPSIPTQYIVTGTTATGCTAKDTIFIGFHPLPTITITNDTSICENSSLQLSVSGGQSYLWSPLATLNDATSPTPIATPTSNTTYYVDILDNYSCQTKDSVVVSLKPLPVFTISPPVNICYSDSIQLLATGGNSYSWSPGQNLSSSTSNNPFASPDVTTTYFVTITDNSCNQSSILSTIVTVLPQPDINATKSSDIDCTNDRVQLNATGGTSYQWSPSSTLSNPGIANPVASPRSNTDYFVTGWDANGCKNYDTISIKVENINKGGYLMASGFTPNGDGLNDCYGIKYWGVIQEVEFSVYNRWGERVFFTTNPAQCWNGKFKGVDQDGGVFVYTIKAKTNCEVSVFRKGTFVLIR